MDVCIEVLEITLFPNIPQHGGSPPYNLSYRSITAEPQADAFGRADIAAAQASNERGRKLRRLNGIPKQKNLLDPTLRPD
jgi:hypothetical protein